MAEKAVSDGEGALWFNSLSEEEQKRYSSLCSEIQSDFEDVRSDEVLCDDVGSREARAVLERGGHDWSESKHTEYWIWENEGSGTQVGDMC